MKKVNGHNTTEDDKDVTEVEGEDANKKVSSTFRDKDGSVSCS